MYKNRSLATDSSPLQVPCKKFIKLALIKKKKVSREDADNFTSLTLQGDIDQILQAKEPIEMKDIFNSNTRLVVVEGAPGIGKSTFAWELCRQWPTLKCLKLFSLVVLLRLREEAVQTAECISDLLYHNMTDLSKSVGQQVQRREGEGVLFVFDGFDEFPAKFRKSCNHPVVKVIEGSCLPKSKVIVTSRPSATADLQSLGQETIEKEIEIVGFSQKEIQKYAEESFKSQPDVLANFITYLSANPVVKGMMYNPLNCSIIVRVYQHSKHLCKSIPHTMTQLYSELTLFLLSRQMLKTEDPLASELPDELKDIDPNNGKLCKELV